MLVWCAGGSRRAAAGARPSCRSLVTPHTTLHWPTPQKWEAHVRELQAGPAAIRNPAIDAIAAWAGVSSKARAAMKRSSPAAVQAIEAPILAFLQQARCLPAVCGGRWYGREACGSWCWCWCWHGMEAPAPALHQPAPDGHTHTPLHSTACRMWRRCWCWRGWRMASTD